MITDHRKLRRVIQWAFPDRLVELSEAWDGVENRQTYLNRAATWNGVPITPAQIDAEEANYDAAIAAVKATRDADEAEAEIAASKALTGLIDVLRDRAFTAQGKTRQQMIDAIKAKLP